MLHRPAPKPIVLVLNSGNGVEIQSDTPLILVINDGDICDDDEEKATFSMLWRELESDYYYYDSFSGPAMQEVVTEYDSRNNPSTL